MRLPLRRASGLGLRASGRIGAVALIAACTTDVPAAKIGAELAADPSLSTSPVNVFSCASCHATTVGDVPAGGPIYPGADLVDSTHRPSWWGGGERRLLDAMNFCLVTMMGGTALDESDPRARELDEWLESISPDDPSPAIPFTVVLQTDDLAPLAAEADAASGRALYRNACRGCHGEPVTGEGKIGSKTSTVPTDTVDGPVCAPTDGSTPPADCVRAVTVEKIRHGRFFDIGGLMPPFSTETLSDAQIADVLAYLKLDPVP
jgi:thiosulfate dehydrogenase